MPKMFSKLHITRRWLQYVATFTASISMFVAGMFFVWTSPSLPKLYAPDSIIPITVAQGSWIASLELIADIPGAPFGAFSADYFGRKYTILLTAIPYLIGWILIAFASNVYMIMVAKFLVGIADGSTFTILPMYIGEIVEDDIRGRLGNSMTVMLDAGAVFLYSVGSWIEIRPMAFIGMIFPIVLMVCFCFIPESPYYLLMKNKNVKAKHALQKFRGIDDVDEEFNEMSTIVKHQMSQTSYWSDLYKNPAYFKGLVILIGLKSMQMMSGIYAMLVFAEMIFSQAGGVLSGPVASIVFGCVQFLSGFGAMLIVDLVGRRPLLIISCLGCGLSLSVQAIYFYLQYYNIMDLTAVGWIPITVMIIYISMYSVGLGAIPLMIPSEMFPTNIKAKALCVTDLYLALLGFVIVFVYQSVVNAFGSHIPFTVFALSCFLSIFFVIFIMPETKGRSLEEIQQYLRGEISMSKSGKHKVQSNDINNSKVDNTNNTNNAMVTKL